MIRCSERILHLSQCFSNDRHPCSIGGPRPCFHVFCSLCGILWRANAELKDCQQLTSFLLVFFLLKMEHLLQNVPDRVSRGLPSVKVSSCNTWNLTGAIFTLLFIPCMSGSHCSASLSWSCHLTDNKQTNKYISWRGRGGLTAPTTLEDSNVFSEC